MKSRENPRKYHGFTVVLYTSGPTVYIGRWDERVGDQIFLNDAAVHQNGEDGLSTEEFVLNAARFGPRVTFPRHAVAAAEVREVRTLGEISKELLGY